MSDKTGEKGLSNEEFRRFGHEIVDWIADYMQNIEKYPVRSPLGPGDAKKRLPGAPPDLPEPMDEILRDFESIILPGITHWQHPGWFAYFPANTSPASVLAEFLTAGLGVQGMVWLTSPAAAELEEVVCNWLRGMLELPESWNGVIQDTASTATLCALLTARERATDFASNEKGIRRTLRVYASEEAHSSVDKAVKIAGYGRENLVRIPTDARFAMIPDKLEAAVAADLERGLVPACVSATVGTTSSGGVDPLPEIGAICRRRGLWLHVDAAWAGTAAVLPEKRRILDGIEMADSFVFNPHKWMLTNFDCSVYFVRDPGLLIRTFEIHPEYLKTGKDAVVRNYRDWGIQLGRRFRALKLWFVIRSYGVEGIRDMVREHIRLAGLFKSRLDEDSRFELPAPVDLSLVCFRLNAGRPPETLNAINAELLERVNATGRVFLTHTALRGVYTLRLVVGQRTTEERHVLEAWDIISAEADKLLATPS